MKIALVGNLAGTANEMLLGLRRAGVEADLFVSPRDLQGMFHDLAGQAAYRREWVRCFDPVVLDSSQGRTAGQLIHALATQRAGLARALLDYDIIHSHTCTLNFSALGYLLYVRMRMRPYLAFATGSDFRELAHHGRGPFAKMARDFFRRADKTLLLNADMVEIRDDVLPEAEFFPFVVDEQKYAPREVPVRPQEQEGKLLCYMMSNLDFGKTDGGAGRRGVKANDRFLLALDDFRKIDRKIHAIVTYRGPDKDEARKLVQELGLQDYVSFVPPVTELGRVELIATADVVLDQFTAGSFGLGAVQIMSMGKPLITYFNDDYVAGTYGTAPPILNASTREEILLALLAARDPGLRATTGASARRWVLENHASAVVIPRLIRLYREALGTRDGARARP
jgi:glycosyltransferase involved in cell wall biosynthesis